MNDQRACEPMKKKSGGDSLLVQEPSLAETQSSGKTAPGRLASFLLLSKMLLSFYIGLSAAAGCLFHPDGRMGNAIKVWAGVTLSAMAGSILNNIQDRFQDQAFNRTMWRLEALESAGILPLLKGAGLMVVLGVMLVVDASGRFRPAAMVLTGLLMYNGIYTPLKKKSHLALIPGALCGMAALLSGWMAAGGSPMDKGALSAAFVVGLWQVPHAMIQNLKHADDLRKGGYPSLTKFFNDPDLAFISLMWVMLYNLSLYHLLFMASFSDWAMFLLFANAGFLTPLFAHILFTMKKPGIAFIFLNLSLLVFFIALMVP